MTLNLSDFPNVFVLGNYSRKDIACMSPLPSDAYVATFSELNGIAYQVCKYLLTYTTVVKTSSHLSSPSVMMRHKKSFQILHQSKA